jgi:hypothetical protein
VAAAINEPFVLTAELSKLLEIVPVVKKPFTTSDNVKLIPSEVKPYFERFIGKVYQTRSGRKQLVGFITDTKGTCKPAFIDTLKPVDRFGTT